MLITIVLDLDLTLIESDYIWKPRLKNVDSFPILDEYFVYVRPGARQFIKDLQKYFNVGVWTAAGDEYADAIVDELFEEQPAFVWTSKNCMTVAGSFTGKRYSSRNNGVTTYRKPLRFLNFGGKVTINRCLVVDDNPVTYSENERNAVPIRGWTKTRRHDNTLPRMAEYLINTFARYKGDVRDIKIKSFK